MTNEWFKPGEHPRARSSRASAQLARKYVDRMAELGGACDFALDIARFYPLQVIMSILGVPESDEPLMLDLTQKIFGADDPDFGVGSDQARDARRDRRDDPVLHSASPPTGARIRARTSRR